MPINRQHSIYLNYRLQTLMYQGLSQNNLLIEKQEQYNFHDSLVIAPIRMQPSQIGHNLLTKTLNSTLHNLGPYQKHKLTDLLTSHNELTEQQTNQTTYTYPHNLREMLRNSGTVIDVVTLDEDSNVAVLEGQFVELMGRYGSGDVCFVAVVGERQGGKSLFCDRVLNLAEIRGCQYGRKNRPGIITYSTPFIKDGLSIFLLELAHCSLDSQPFKLLNVIALMLSSAYIYIEDLQKAGKSFEDFQKSMRISAKLFGCEEAVAQGLLGVENFYYLARGANGKKFVDGIREQFGVFREVSVEELPNAMAEGYRGDKQDLKIKPFIVKQCINPSYIHRISEIFRKVHSELHEKKYQDLILTGSITIKLLQSIVSSLNAKQYINSHALFQKVLKELYISAYNYCILGYHDELEEYFSDEQPKNTGEMYTVFEKATYHALEKFGEFRLNKELHQEYEAKILDHVDRKEGLLCVINREKTKEVLLEEFKKYEREGDLRKVFKRLKEFRKELDDGREEAYQEILSQLYRRTDGDNPALVRKLNDLTQQKQSLQKALQKSALKYDQVKKAYDDLQRSEAEVDKQIKKINGQISGLSAVDAEGIKKLKNQVQALKEKKMETQERLRSLRGEDNAATLAQLRQGFQEKIKAIIIRQKQIQKQLQQIQKGGKQNPQTKTPSKTKLPADASKLKSSEVKKQPAKQPTVKKSEAKQPKPKPK